MKIELNEKLKNECVEKMTNNLVVLRTMLHLSQEDLAKLIGISRQTLTMIENRKRKMTWSVFLSLMFVFTQSRETNSLLEILGVYPKKLKSLYSDIENKKD